MSAFRGRRRAPGSARTTAPQALNGHGHEGSGCAICDRLAEGTPLSFEEAIALMGDSELVWDEDDDEAAS